MPVSYNNDRLMVWASEIDANTLDQALKASRLPIVPNGAHVALMPDAHLGKGATIGSVIPTVGAVIPSAVGVDLGCGMIACRTNLTASQLPDDLSGVLDAVSKTIPAGVGAGHGRVAAAARRFLDSHQPASELDAKQWRTAAEQFGSLGSGNHFVEVCLDESDGVWVLLHSGSRGIGNQLASAHITKARAFGRQMNQRLEDPDLAWFLEGTDEFKRYVADMLWAQSYALANREAMLDNALPAVFAAIGTGAEVERINCHHNFCQREVHVVDGVEMPMWITRKGAIQAQSGQLGLIPGSMGTRSYVVAGLGSDDSFHSCSHGAGRRLSRNKAKQLFTAEDLAEQMAGKMWQADLASKLVDEIPSAYKDIDQVMADQTDLVEVRHTLRQVLNYKGT